MPTPYDIPASVLIERLANYLKEEVDEINPPTWSSFAKTGIYAQRPPRNPDWWFVRSASILRKIYVKGPIGIELLRQEYGGRVDRGARPEHARKGGGAIIRNVLKQLQSAGFILSQRNEGRVLTSKGRQLLDRLSTELKRQLEKTLPELAKY
ncbi:30S ribosomal protein S19e [Candidatus Bathyarchaeota archaeon]|nr:30S ribosomal protein S19e [Candidatus Bathyarchaeota archaeon]